MAVLRNQSATWWVQRTFTLQRNARWPNSRMEHFCQREIDDNLCTYVSQLRWTARRSRKFATGQAQPQGLTLPGEGVKAALSRPPDSSNKASVARTKL